jgi:hypothetical protein
MSASTQATAGGSWGARMQSSGRIDQTFATTNGQTYYVAARIRIDQQISNPTWGGLRIQIVNSSWQQLATSSYLTTSNSPAGQWTEVRFTFVATGSSTRLLYQNFSGGGQFVASADDLIVSASPIPAYPTPIPGP